MGIKSAARDRYKKLTPRQKTAALCFIAFVGLLFIIILLKGCQAIAASKRSAPPEPILLRQDNHIIVTPHSPLRTQMKLKAVHSSNVPHVVSLPGTVEADPTRTVDIIPPLTGRLVSIRVNLGDVVKPGQVLAVINSPDLAQAYSDHDKAVSVRKLTSAALKRAREVNRVGGNAIKDVQMAQNDDVQALADLNQTQAKLKTFGNNTFGLLTIRAPIKGQITALNYGMGSYINDTTAALLSISNIDSVWITANVPEHLVGVITQGQRVTIDLPAYPNLVWHGKVAFVNAFLDPDTRRNQTRIAMPNPGGKLQPNMYATVRVSVPQSHFVMIPISAVLMNDDTTSVYVETAPWTFQRRVVQLGAEDGHDVRVVSGLKPGERIAASGGIFIND